MVRRQPIHLVLGTMSFLALAAWGIAGARAQPPRVAKSEATASKARAFVPARLMRVFRGNHEEARQKELDNIERFHLDEAAIRQLPDDAWFEIIAYNDSEQVYRGKLTPATPGEKSGAAQFLYSLVADGKTDIYDTLFDALAVDPNLEAILFLSDGDPNVGTIVDRATIVQRITQQNASRRISINTIGIDARGPSEDFLKQLAAGNFGEYRSSR